MKRLAILALLLAGCVSAPTPARAHLDLDVSPRVGLAPLMVHVVARVVGELDRDRWACASFAWNWGDGSTSTHLASDCLEPQYSWSASHRYVAPGVYLVGFGVPDAYITQGIEVR